MCTFNYGGQSYETLDYGVMSSTPRRSYTSKNKSFHEKALTELKEELTEKEKKEPIIMVYAADGYIYHTCETKSSIALSLAGQDNAVRSTVKRMHPCNAVAVYFRHANGATQLWKACRYSSADRPLYLNKELLISTLKKTKYFTNISVRLGQLTEKGIKYIAWQVSTDQGVYYIPWHNGSFVEDNVGLNFEEKDFKELRQTYAILRFALCVGEHDTYRILTA